MFSKYTILIAEDFEGQHELLANELKKHNTEVFTCENKDINLEIGAIKYSPEIIVLNCCLIGYQKTMSFIERLNSNDIYPVFYNIYTYEDSEIIRQLLDCGSVISISVPYSAPAVCSHIMQRLEEIPLDIHAFKEMIHKSVSDFVIATGVSPNNDGYSYLVDCIFNLLMNYRGKVSLKTQLYPETAVRYDKNEHCIEHSIRIAINSAWKKLSDEDKRKYFPVCAESGVKPTNSVYIAQAAELIKDKYMDIFIKYYKTCGH